MVELAGGIQVVLDTMQKHPTSEGMPAHLVENDSNPTGLGDASPVVVVDRQAPECRAGMLQEPLGGGVFLHRVENGLNSAMRLSLSSLLADMGHRL